MTPIVALLALASAMAAAGESRNDKDALSNTAYDVRVKAGGDAIMIEGALTLGAAAAFDAALGEAPAVRRVELDSPGGLVVEAEKIAEAIRARRLDTHVAGVCFSACTHVLLAGFRRTVAPRGRIGFHRAYTMGDDERTPDDSAPYGAIIARAFYEKAKLPAAFIERIFATPSSRMWMPSRKELVAAGVLTGP